MPLKQHQQQVKQPGRLPVEQDFCPVEAVTIQVRKEKDGSKQPAFDVPVDSDRHIMTSLHRLFVFVRLFYYWNRSSKVSILDENSRWLPIARL